MWREVAYAYIKKVYVYTIIKPPCFQVFLSPGSFLHVRDGRRQGAQREYAAGVLGLERAGCPGTSPLISARPHKKRLSPIVKVKYEKLHVDEKDPCRAYETIDISLPIIIFNANRAKTLEV